MYIILHKPSGMYVSSGGSTIYLTSDPWKVHVFKTHGYARAHILRTLSVGQPNGSYKDMDNWAIQKIRYVVEESNSIMDVIGVGEIMKRLSR